MVIWLMIVKVNNLILDKIKNFFIKCEFDEDPIKIGSMNFNERVELQKLSL